MGTKIEKYLQDYFSLLQSGDDWGIQELEETHKDEVITLPEVAKAIITLSEDLADHIEVTHELSEARIRAIVSFLPEETQEAIKERFAEVEDYILHEDITEEEK